MGDYMRSMRTTQELREVQNAIDQGIKVRGKRKKNYLPDAWWDFWRRSQRTWKRHRKTQYKGK